MRHVCYWQHQSTLEKMMDIKETSHGVYFLWAKIKPFAPALAADGMLSKLDKQDTKENDYQTLPRQSMKVLQKSCFTEKSVKYSRSVGRFPNIAKEPWMTVQMTIFFSSFLTFFGSRLLVLPA